MIITEDQFSNYEKRKRANFINCFSGLKPANLVGSIDGNDRTNLAIISSVFHLGADPALVGMILRPDSVRRDTLENIRANGYYTINHVNASIYKQAHQTSARYDTAVSEFEATKLTPQYLNSFKAPFVQESHMKFGVELVEELKISQNSTHLLIGNIKLVSLEEDSLREDGTVDMGQLDPVCISGLDTYYSVNKLSRLSYAKVNKELSEVE